MPCAAVACPPTDPAISGTTRGCVHALVERLVVAGEGLTVHLPVLSRQVVFNPKDPNTFASASLDRTIKVWGLTSANAHFTLEGHEKGVNCIDYFPGGDKPFLISGADDKTVKNHKSALSQRHYR